MKISQGIYKADQYIAGKLGSKCDEGQVGCSDILGATRVLDTQLSDIQRKDGSIQEGATVEFNVCTIFASDMMHYDIDGPLTPRKWDGDVDNGSEAASLGRDASFKYLGSDGLPQLTGGTEVYMPYLGNLTYNKKRSIHEVNEMKFFWEAFFQQASTEVSQGSTGLACSGHEPHKN